MLFTISPLARAPPGLFCLRGYFPALRPGVQLRACARTRQPTGSVPADWWSGASGFCGFRRVRSTYWLIENASVQRGRANCRRVCGWQCIDG